VNDTVELPESIKIYEGERSSVDPDLAFAYIAEVAKDTATILTGERPWGVAEIAYQPGDGTRYNLVIVPLTLMAYARPRVANGRIWERHAVSGIDYDGHGYLVCLVDGHCYPLRLGDRGVLAASYIAEHWKLPDVSAVSVALLLRAISHELDA